MKHAKQLPHVVAMILVTSTALLSLIFAPDADTFETISSPMALPQPPAATTPTPIVIESPKPAEPDGWERFEAEFGAAREAAPPHLAPLSEAKYHVDLTIYTVNTVLHRFEDLLELRYSNGHIGRSAVFRTPSPAHLRPGLFTIEDARLKFDFDFARGKPYAGIRLVLPFGN